MATDAALVEVAATGAVYVAALGATPPTNATAAWSTAWGELGYMNEDGVNETPSLDIEEIKAWQSGAIVRKVITGSGLDFAFTAIETNLKTIDLFYPGSVITQVAGPPLETKHEIKLPVATPKAFGIDAVDGTKRVRIVIPRAQISDRGEVPYRNNAPVAYPFTISAEPDSSQILAIKYFNPQLT
jgi:hypothetical protein